MNQKLREDGIVKNRTEMQEKKNRSQTPGQGREAFHQRTWAEQLEAQGHSPSRAGRAGHGTRNGSGKYPVWGGSGSLAGGAGAGSGKDGSDLLWQAVLAVLVLLTAAAIVFYVYRAQRYYTVFLPHTVVNGMDVSGKTPEEVKELISGDVKDYSLTLLLRDRKQEKLTGEAIGLHTVFDGSLEEIIFQQNPYAWPRYILKGPAYDIQAMIEYDREAVGRELSRLDCFDEAVVTPPADAYLSDYISGQGYTIVPEVEGDKLDREETERAVCAAVDQLETELNLEDSDCYERPSLRADNPALTEGRDARNRYVNMTVTYMFGSSSEILDGERIHQWLEVGENQEVSLNQEAIADYVLELAQKYNTAYKKRSFATSYGQTVEVSGFYGWRISQKEEAAQLAAVLEAGEDTVREPVYAQKAASHDGNDYGNTYAEVNLTAQHMYFYKDGIQVLETDFVSGNVNKGHTTPPGIFSINYKQRDAVLKGEGYASPVKFWMPFNGGIGFHDASWRSSFGSSIYKTNGSHGCINMPYEAARTLFENVYAGMPVICYNLEGTESKEASNASGKAPAAANAASSGGAQTGASQTSGSTQAGAAEASGGNGQTGAAGTQVETPPTTSTPPEEAQPSAAQPNEGSESSSGQAEPDISIQPVGEDSSGGNSPGGDAADSGPVSGGSTADQTEGYGPAFQSAGAHEEGGPGVN